MLITNYNNFILEANDNTYPLILSDKLIKLLSNIKSDIAIEILSDYKNHINHDISFLDCNLDDKDKSDKLSYLPCDRFLKTPQMTDVYESRLRQELSIGKIVNKLFPGKFSPAQVELFVNDYKGKITAGFSDFYLAQGEEIRYWYNENNYKAVKGSMGSSCMRYDYAQNFLDIYCKNPEKVKLLVLFSDKSKTKIKGRAIVWNGLKKPIEIVGNEKIESKILMDRIYTSEDSDQNAYIEYAIKNNWLYKARQVMRDSAYIENGKIMNGTIAITLKPLNLKLYPSVDTLCYYTPSTGRLASYPGFGIPGHPRFILNDTNGGTTKVD
jgi:hypothetical protein